MKIRTTITLSAATIALAIAATATADSTTFVERAYEAQQRPSQPVRKWKVKMEDVHVRRSPDGNVFSGIVPCTRVLRTIWEAAQDGKAYSLKYHLKYTSEGKTTVKNLQIPLASMKVSRGHTSTPDYVVVTTVVDVASKPVDEGAKVTADVHLNHKPASR